MNKKYAFAMILSLWLILLIGFISVKEFTAKTGEKGLLKTMPVDPRDLFRGDYVALQYEISSVNLNELGVNQNFSKGDKVYASLKKQGEYFSLNNVSSSRPSPLYLSGTVTYASRSSLILEYGIESYFVPEGKGQQFESAAQRDRIDVEVSVDRFGNAVITGLFLDGKKAI